MGAPFDVRNTDPIQPVRYQRKVSWALVVSIALGVLALAFVLQARAADVEPFLMYSHDSDLFRGPPFNHETEPTTDFIGAGVTIEWRKFELDLAQGFKSRDCNYVRRTNGQGSYSCVWESGTQITARWYWRRK